MIRKNWFLNAACKGNGAKPNSVIDVADNSLVWEWAGQAGWCATSKPDSSGSYVEWILNVGDECAGKPMVFACELGYVGSAVSRGEVVQIIGSDGISLAGLPPGRPAQRAQLFRFTAPADGVLRIRFRGPRGDSEPAQLAVYRPQLELADTYDNRGTTPAYFNGDTYPRNSGA